MIRVKNQRLCCLVSFREEERRGERKRDYHTYFQKGLLTWNVGMFTLERISAITDCKRHEKVKKPLPPMPRPSSLEFPPSLPSLPTHPPGSLKTMTDQGQEQEVLSINYELSAMYKWVVTFSSVDGRINFNATFPETSEPNGNHHHRPSSSLMSPVGSC